MKKQLPLLLTFITFLCWQCNSPVEKEEEQTEIMELPQSEPVWARNANIYEVNIRQYTPEGTINAFRTGHLERLSEMGVDILWLMPIFPISSTKRKGSLGSYYAVSNFREVNPEFGTLEDVEQLLQEAHDLGMKVILDWVPNHTGWDHVWIKEHPDYYTQKEGEITDPLNDEGESHGWTDVADLNYENPELRKTMTTDLLYWVEEIGVDGFRMDVAFLVPEDFWNLTIERLRTVKPDIFMLAEAEEANLRNMEHPFTASYAWSFHHLLNRLAQQEDSLASIDQWLIENEAKFGQGYNMQFITNHDENSWNGTIEERMGEAANALAVLAFTLEGMPLIYSVKLRWCPTALTVSYFYAIDPDIKSRTHTSKVQYNALIIHPAWWYTKGASVRTHRITLLNFVSRVCLYERRNSWIERHHPVGIYWVAKTLHFPIARYKYVFPTGYIKVFLVKVHRSILWIGRIVKFPHAI